VDARLRREPGGGDAEVDDRLAGIGPRIRQELVPCARAVAGAPAAQAPELAREAEHEALGGNVLEDDRAQRGAVDERLPRIAGGAA